MKVNGCELDIFTYFVIGAFKRVVFFICSVSVIHDRAISGENRSKKPWEPYWESNKISTSPNFISEADNDTSKMRLSRQGSFQWQELSIIILLRGQKRIARWFYVIQAGSVASVQRDHWCRQLREGFPFEPIKLGSYIFLSKQCQKWMPEKMGILWDDDLVQIKA